MLTKQTRHSDDISPARAAVDGRSGAFHGDTVESDENYDLVSVLYHALKAAQVHWRYAEDARESGDRELADFFRAIHEGDLTRAERAKGLLGKRLATRSDEFEVASAGPDHR